MTSPEELFSFLLSDKESPITYHTSLSPQTPGSSTPKLMFNHNSVNPSRWLMLFLCNPFGPGFLCLLISPHCADPFQALLPGRVYEV